MPPRVTHTFEAPGQLRETVYIDGTSVAASPPPIAFAIMGQNVSAAIPRGGATFTQLNDLSTQSARDLALQVQFAPQQRYMGSWQSTQVLDYSTQYFADWAPKTGFTPVQVTRPGQSFTTPPTEFVDTKAFTVTNIPYVKYQGSAYATQFTDAGAVTTTPIWQQVAQQTGRPPVAGWAQWTQVLDYSTQYFADWAPQTTFMPVRIIPPGMSYTTQPTEFIPVPSFYVTMPGQPPKAGWTQWTQVLDYSTQYFADWAPQTSFAPKQRYVGSTAYTSFFDTGVFVPPVWQQTTVSMGPRPVPPGPSYMTTVKGTEPMTAFMSVSLPYVKYKGSVQSTIINDYFPPVTTWNSTPTFIGAPLRAGKWFITTHITAVPGPPPPSPEVNQRGVLGTVTASTVRGVTGGPTVVDRSILGAATGATRGTAGNASGGTRGTQGTPGAGSGRV